MKAFGKHIRAVLLTIAGLALVLMMVVGFGDVFARHAFSASIVQREELFNVLLIICFLCSFPVITQARDHLDVDLLDALFNSPKKRQLQLLVIDMLVGISCLVMSYWLYDKAQRISRAGREVMYEMLGWQQAWFAKAFALMLLITGFLMCVLALRHLVLLLRNQAVLETFHHKDNL